MAGREQCGVPAEQPFGGDRFRAVCGGIEHHVHHAVDRAIGWRQSTDVYTQAACNRRADRIDRKLFAFDGAGLDHVIGQRFERGTITQGHSRIGQPAGKQTLCAAGFGQGRGERRQIVVPVRPVGSLPDIGVITASHAEIVAGILRSSNRVCACRATCGSAIAAGPVTVRSCPPPY